MSSKVFSSNVVVLALFLMTVVVARYSAAEPADPQSSQPAPRGGRMQQTVTDVTGTWSGTFFSRHSNVASFTITLVITPGAGGHLIGASTLNSDCLKAAKFQVTVAGSTVVLAGSDKEGDNITIRGTVDTTGTLLSSTYILNGSATGACETDDGTGSLAKR